MVPPNPVPKTFTTAPFPSLASQPGNTAGATGLVRLPRCQPAPTRQAQAQHRHSCSCAWKNHGVLRAVELGSGAQSTRICRCPAILDGQWLSDLLTQYGGCYGEGPSSVGPSSREPSSHPVAHHGVETIPDTRAARSWATRKRNRPPWTGVTGLAQHASHRQASGRPLRGVPAQGIILASRRAVNTPYSVFRIPHSVQYVPGPQIFQPPNPLHPTTQRGLPSSLGGAANWNFLRLLAVLRCPYSAQQDGLFASSSAVAISTLLPAVRLLPRPRLASVRHCARVPCSARHPEGGLSSIHPPSLPRAPKSTGISGVHRQTAPDPDLAPSVPNTSACL
ncbi:hypothetical protein BT67DRAFT_109557 [Trichocladium antarcticum]|uniref:Uncharacterized protein n=1 Tax=Trichocladium antarcticum TaxID=1450529 RepID=A0AAN6UR58_9PEZI|nr:hypothetical protein BT67DRAFT_109557 [Trichocladium antarcticum]